MNTPAPLVSVVMSVFNAGAYLRSAVESILRQSFSDFEFIIIDDGSSDGSGEALEEASACDSRIRLIRQENRGLIASLNRGCALAQGTYIARMDADDEALPERLALQVSYMEAYPSILVLGGAIEQIDPQGASLRRRAVPGGDAELRAQLLDRNCFWHPTVMMRRDALVAAGGYRSVPGAEDYDLWLRLAEQGQVENLGRVLVRYRMHSGQLTVVANRTMSLSALVSRGAAFARRAGQPDPLDTQAISEEVLEALMLGLHPLPPELPRGGDRSRRLRSYLRWIVQSAALGPRLLSAAQLALESPAWKAVSAGEAAEVRYALASLYRLRNAYSSCAGTALRAVAVKPALLGRSLRRAIFGKPKRPGLLPLDSEPLSVTVPGQAQRKEECIASK